MKPFAIIGCGKLGSSLYRALVSIGFEAGVVIDRQKLSSEITDQIPARIYRQSINVNDLVQCAVIFVTVNDDQINSVAADLAECEIYGKIIVHTSGANDSGQLSMLRAKGAFTGSWHPLQTFDRLFLPPDVWQAITCTFEGDPEAEQQVAGICRKLQANLVQLTKEQKLAVHLAGTITANYTVSLLNTAEDILSDAGINNTDRKNMLFPLLEQVLKNYRTRDVKEILSGPVQRGDFKTIKKHIDYLARHCDDNKQKMYLLLAEILIDDQKIEIVNRDVLKESLGKI